MSEPSPQAIHQFLESIDRWRKAISNLKQGGRQLEAKANHVKAAGKTVVTLLEDSQVAEAIASLMASANANLPEVAQELHQRLLHQPDRLVSREMESLGPLQLKRKELETLVLAYCHSLQNNKTFPAADQLPAHFMSLQSALMEEIEATRPLNRKQKKRRKRQIATGILFTVSGLGLLAGNTLVDSNLAGASYILGGNALMQAVRDLVGEALET